MKKGTFKPSERGGERERVFLLQQPNTMFSQQLTGCNEFQQVVLLEAVFFSSVEP